MGATRIQLGDLRCTIARVMGTQELLVVTLGYEQHYLPDVHANQSSPPELRLHSCSNHSAVGGIKARILKCSNFANFIPQKNTNKMGMFGRTPKEGIDRKSVV